MDTFVQKRKCISGLQYALFAKAKELSLCLRLFDGFLDSLFPSFLDLSIFFLQFMLCLFLQFFEWLVLCLVCFDLWYKQRLAWRSSYLNETAFDHTAASLSDPNFSFQSFSLCRSIFCFSFSRTSGSLSDICEKADIRLAEIMKSGLLEKAARNLIKFDDKVDGSMAD